MNDRAEPEAGGSQATRVGVASLPSFISGAPLPDPQSTGPAAWVGREVDDYRILRVIGAGGMGVVFLAQQRHPKRMVAIKTLHAGLHQADLLARFQQEAEILGRLKHPGIAQIYASGQTNASLGSVPYIVMEFVEGEPLLEFCGSQDMRQRLELLRRLCEAVEHAHIRGVIHRDLKPGNILVQPDGQPKVLDFGVARLTGEDHGPSELTSAGMIVGTIAFMSPEQAIGEPGAVDIRTDVYALGMIGYRMLTGDMPYEVTGHHLGRALQQICETEPTPLSRHDRRYRGDLETVFQKALAKDKEARYQNAAELAEDLRRYLADEAILARRASVFSDIRRFARRNKTLVGAAVLVLMALVGAVAVSTRFALEEQAQRRQADAMVGFMRAMLSSANPVFAQGSEVTVRSVMDQARGTLERDLADAPAARARMRATLAETYKALGELPVAIEYYDSALRDFDTAGEIGGEREAVLVGRARALLDSGRVREARDQLRALLDSAGDETTPARMSARVHFAAALAAMGDNQAREQFERGLALLASHPGQTCPACMRDWDLRLQIWAWARQAAFELASGDAPAALRAAEHATTIAHERLESTDPDTLVALTQLSLAYAESGRASEARTLLEAAYAERRRVLGDSHWQTLSIAGNLALAMETDGELEAANALFRESLGRARQGLASDNPELGILQANFGMYLYRAGEVREAEELLGSAHQLFSKVLGATHPETLTAALNLAVLYTSKGDFEKARPLMESALAGTEARFGDVHRQTIAVGSEYASFLRDRGEYVEADRAFDKAWTNAQRVLPLGDRDRLRVLFQYSGSLQRQGRFEEAEAMSSRLTEEAASSADKDNIYAKLAPLRHAKSLIGLRRNQEAERMLIALDKRLDSSADAQLRKLSRTTLAELYQATGRPEEAKKLQ